MRLPFVFGTLLLLPACGANARSSRDVSWLPRAEAHLGVKLEVQDDWAVDAVDDAILLRPRRAHEEFVIVVLRGAAPPNDGLVVARLGQYDRLVLSKPTDEQTRAGLAHVKYGTAVSHGDQQPLHVRLARVDESAGQATFVVAAMRPDSEAVGDSAFDHVLRTLVFSVPPRTTTAAPKAPDWLDPKKKEKEKDDDDMERKPGQELNPQSPSDDEGATP